MATVRIFGREVQIEQGVITCDDPKIEEALRDAVPADLPEGYYVTIDHAIVKMLMARGGEVIAPPATPPTKEGRVY
jgi:hypothetical protein